MIPILLVFLMGCVKQPFILTDTYADAVYEGVDPVWVAPWEDGMRTDGGKNTVEWWYFDGHFDDGTTVAINFLTKPIMKRGQPLTPKLELTVTEPDGTTHQSFTFHDAEDFSSSAEHCDVRILDSTFQGDLETYTLHVEADDMVVDLTLDREVPSWRPGAGKVYFDADRTQYLGWVVPVPHGAATGTVTVGDRTWDVTGTGYHDHNWTNTDISKPIDHWYWGRGHIGPYTTLYIVAGGSRRWGHAPLKLFMLAEDDRIMISGAEGLDLTTREYTTDDPPYPQELLLSVEHEGTLVTLEMLDPEILEREDLLSSMSPPVRWFLKLFMDPWYLRFQADTALTIEDYTAENETIYELMKF